MTADLSGLTAAITDELAFHCWVVRHRDSPGGDRVIGCGRVACDWTAVWPSDSRATSRELYAAHQAERVVARLAVVAPTLPPDAQAALIGGTVMATRPAPITGRANRSWAVGPSVPDSPPHRAARAVLIVPLPAVSTEEPTDG